MEGTAALSQSGSNNYLWSRYCVSIIICQPIHFIDLSMVSHAQVGGCGGHEGQMPGWKVQGAVLSSLSNRINGSSSCCLLVHLL